MTCRCAKGWDSGLVGRTDSSWRSHFILKLPIKWCWWFSTNAQTAKQKTSQHGGEWHIAMETKLLCCASLFKIKSAVCLLPQLLCYSSWWINVSTLQPITEPAFLISWFSSDVTGTRWTGSPLWSFPYCTSPMETQQIPVSHTEARQSVIHEIHVFTDCSCSFFWM